ncbi:hypothetical protein GGI25_004228 [Coemansia spiralis]|uniref:Uncharacterized protein n=1 Tax=Coemansia spiralis TaxID=417178 RepID=A0A9W8G570_9FUNG|nr:hypothetical protein GGI25_004228 [Coemansia spiralis]
MFEISNDWKLFAEKNEKLLERNYKTLAIRRRELSKIGRKIFPEDDKIFEVMSFIKPEDIRRVIILPHPYNFNSGTGIPCMIRDNIQGKKTKSLVNIQKIFNVKDDDFTNIWKDGVFLWNISLTQEEGEDESNIPHEVFWSLLFEALLEFLSTNYRNIKFYLSGSNSVRYKKFINLSNGHEMFELPAITKDDFAEAYNSTNPE